MRNKKPRPLRVAGTISPIAFVGVHGAALFIHDVAVWIDDELDPLIKWLVKAQKWSREKKRKRR